MRKKEEGRRKKENSKRIDLEERKKKKWQGRFKACEGREYCTVHISAGRGRLQRKA